MNSAQIFDSAQILHHQLKVSPFTYIWKKKKTVIRYVWNYILQNTKGWRHKQQNILVFKKKTKKKNFSILLQRNKWHCARLTATCKYMRACVKYAKVSLQHKTSKWFKSGKVLTLHIVHSWYTLFHIMFISFRCSEFLYKQFCWNVKSLTVFKLCSNVCNANG